MAPTSSRAQRPIRACNRCRKRKVKCSGAEGEAVESGQGGIASVSCTLCHAHAAECIFEQRQPKGPTPKSYVSALESRLASFEALLASLANQTATNDLKTQVMQDAIGEASTGMDSMMSSRAPSPPPTDLDEIQQLSERLDGLTVKMNRYLGRSSGVQIAMSLQEHLTGQESPLSPTISAVEQLLTSERLAMQQPFERPPVDLERRMIDVCFEQLEPWPFIVRQDFETCLSRGRVQTDDGFRSLYFAILALGSRSVSDSRLDIPPSYLCRLPGPALDYAVDARQLRLARGYQYFWASAMSFCPVMAPSLETLQAGLVTALWLLNSTSVVTTWTAVGLLIRAAIDVGAHEELCTRWTASPLQNQVRKRVFHCAVALDRHLSFLLGRPLAVHDADIDVEAPLPVTDEALLEWAAAAQAAKERELPPPPPPQALPSQSEGCRNDAWAMMCGLHQLLAAAYESLHGLKQNKSLEKMGEDVKRLDAQLHAWSQKMPDELPRDSLAQPGKDLRLSAYLHGAYYQLQILVHRDYVASSRFPGFGFPSLSICTNAARSIARLLETQQAHGELVSPWAISAITAVTSSLVLVLAGFAHPDSSTPLTVPELSPASCRPAHGCATLTPSALRDLERCLSALASLQDSTYIAKQCYGGMRRFVDAVFPTHSCKTAGPTGVGQEGEGGRVATCPLAAKLEDDAATNADQSAKAQKRRLSGVPLSTPELSLSTFNGLPTLSSMTALPTSKTSHPPSAKNDTLPSYVDPPPLPASNLKQPASRSFPFFSAPAPSAIETPANLFGDTASLFGFDFDLSFPPFSDSSSTFPLSTTTAVSSDRLFPSTCSGSEFFFQ
ncbi:hypothetical protein JCM11251_001357 [Rhodosporidiobolus azoricus]